MIYSFKFNFKFNTSLSQGHFGVETDTPGKAEKRIFGLRMESFIKAPGLNLKPPWASSPSRPPLDMQVSSRRLFHKFDKATSFPLMFYISKRHLARCDSNGDTRAALLFSHFARIKRATSPQLFITSIKEGIRVSKQNQASLW